MNNKQRIELGIALHQLWDQFYDLSNGIDRAISAASAAQSADLVTMLLEMKQKTDDLSLGVTRHEEDLKNDD